MPKVVPEYREEARRRIMETALGIFMARGYRATKMEDIARGVGVSKGAIYTYFSGKEDLFVQTAEHFRRKYEEEIFGELKKSADTDIFDALFRMFWTFIDGYITLSLELMYLSVTDTDLRSFLEDDARKDAATILRFLQRMQEDGRIRADADAGELARLVTTLFHGFYIRAFLGGSQNEARQIWDAAVAPYRVREQGGNDDRGG
ncbi:MAG: TetR/AcrR family transcriptional regulator [Methanomicrobiales archaeon]|nr:TetR/AcrR family transcriptional regulator [Methanomicrobiales archaeon]